MMKDIAQVGVSAEPEIETTPTVSSLMEGKAKKRSLLGNKVETIPPYDVVPSMSSFCPLLNISQCPPLDALEANESLRLEIYNPLARAVRYTIR